MVGWTRGYTGDPSARKVTHPNTIMALDGLTLEFPWDPS